MIRRKHGKSIPEIFAQSGESVFRADEHSALLYLQHSKRIILATGGGIVTRKENFILLKNLGYVVWLTADEETIWKRVQRNANRPLLQTENPKETITRLLAERAPLYKAVADFIVDSSGLTHHEVLHRILYSMRKSTL
jgi:shikimate kinase